MRPIDEQIACYGAVAAQVPGCDNLGETGDGRDLYAVFDGLLAELQRLLPPMACGDGCHLCCFSPPLVTSVEWAALYPALLALPEAVQQGIIRQAERLRPQAEMLAQHRWFRLRPEQPQPTGILIQCPFLVGGSCAVYRARPLPCRGYGQTSVAMPEGQSLFACTLARAHFDACMAPLGTFALPSFNDYEDRLSEMNGALRGERAYLAQWLWVHVEAGRLKPEADLHPGFDSTGAW